MVGPEDDVMGQELGLSAPWCGKIMPESDAIGPEGEVVEPKLAI